MAMALGGILLLVACAPTPIKMLHERPSFDGVVVMERGGARLSGELVFDRAAGNYQFTRRAASTVVLGRDSAGKLFALENAEPRDLSPQQRADLELVLAVVDGGVDGGADIRAQAEAADHYTVQLSRGYAAWLVRVQERKKPHGD